MSNPSIAHDQFEHLAKRITIDDINLEFADWIKRQGLSGGEAAYNHIDENGDVYRLVSMAWPNKKKAPDEYFIPLKHPETGKDCPVPERGWRNPPQTMAKLLSEGRIIFGRDHTTQPQRKYLLRENQDEGFASVFEYGGSDDSLLAKLDIPFDNPKPVNVAKLLIGAATKGNDIILDFFAGSGTAAHAVIAQNAEDGGTRSFVIVQLPEPTDHPKYKTISEITRERVRRAAKNLKSVQPTLGGAGDQDLGFRAYLLTPSNFIPWDGTASNDADQLANQLKLGIDHTRGDRTPQDLLFEVLLKSWGEPALSLKVGEEAIEGVRIFSIAEGDFLICLEEKVSLEFIRALAARKPSRVVMRESAFAGNDQLKTNAVQTFKSQGVTSFKVV